MQLLDVLDKGWPFGASVLAGAVAFGSLHSDVKDLQTAQATARTDHDSIMHLEQGQSDMKETLADIKAALERIEKK
jgi:hypothetical protein